MASYYSPAAYHYDSAADVPYLTLSGSNAEKCTYVSYEDATSLAAKGAWVKAQGLGGVIIWTISEGYVASGATRAGAEPAARGAEHGAAVRRRPASSRQRLSHTPRAGAGPATDVPLRSA